MRWHLMDNKAQISTELLIVMAAILAIALLLISSLRTSAKSADTKLDANAKNAITEAGKIK